MAFPIVKNKWLPVVLMALTHGINDFFAGYLLAVINKNNTALWAAVAYVFYIAIAFGGQLIFALWVDNKRKYKEYTLFALLLLCTAIIASNYLPLVAIIFSAFASGIYHVSAPPLCMGQTVKKATTTGLFAAPGVIGLSIGGAIGYTLVPIQLWAYIVLLAFVVLTLKSVSKIGVVTFVENEGAKGNKHGFDTHDYLMVLLLLIVALRSALWDIFQMAYAYNYEWLIYIAIAAAAGKILGGIAYEKYNNPIALTFTLVVSTALLQFQYYNRAFLLVGITLLQSTIPACIMLFYRFMPSEPALANSLVMGLAVILGSFAYFLGIDYAYMLIAITILLLLLSMVFTRYFKQNV